MLYYRQISYFFLFLSILFSGCSTYKHDSLNHNNLKNLQKNLNQISHNSYYRIYGSFFLILNKIN